MIFHHYYIVIHVNEDSRVLICQFFGVVKATTGVIVIICKNNKKYNFVVGIHSRRNKSYYYF